MSVELEMKKQREIKQKSGELIRKAQELIDKEVNGLHIYDKKTEGNKKKDILEENQIRNVLDVALVADCEEVIEVFIKYQIGRSGENSKWRFGNFGELLVKSMKKDIYDIAAQIAGELQLSDNEIEINDIWLRLIKLYLGYMNRYFYYKKNTSSEEGA